MFGEHGPLRRGGFDFDRFRHGHDPPQDHAPAAAGFRVFGRGERSLGVVDVGNGPAEKTFGRHALL